MNWTQNMASVVEATLGQDGYALIMERLDERVTEIHVKLADPSTDWETTTRLRGELEGIKRCRPERILSEITRSLEASNGRRSRAGA
jgi:predicted trehalose synthase